MATTVPTFKAIRARLGSETVPFLTAKAPAACLVQMAYNRLSARQGTANVMISDLADEAALPVATVQAHIAAHLTTVPYATLAEGDWSCATSAQRAASMMLRGRPRLYVRFDA